MLAGTRNLEIHLYLPTQYTPEDEILLNNVNTT